MEAFIGIARMIRLALLLIGAAILAISAYSMHLLPVAPLSEAPGWTKPPALIAGALSLVALTCVLAIGPFNRRLTDPEGPIDSIIGGAVLGGVAAATIWHFRELDTLLLPEQVLLAAENRHYVLAGLAGLATLFSLIKSSRRKGGRRKPVGAATPAPAPDRRGSKLKTGQKELPKPVEVPDAGFLMKTYLVADWLLLRLFGAFLIFMAYMIYSTEEWELYKVGGMLYGIAPSTVMYVYAAWGAMLLVPVLLPRFISRPRTVIGGGGKAAVLVGLAILILPGIDAAIDTYVSGPYRSALHSSVPGLFKGIAGLAVFSAMAIALFRNLSRNAPVVLDGMGKPAQRFSADDLRALRSARMQG